MSIRASIGMVIASLLMISCSLSTEAELARCTLVLPDLTLVNAEYVLKDEESEPIAIQAAEISLFDKTNTANLSRLTFTQRDGEGTILVSGRADAAVANTKEWDAQLSGNVEITDYRNDFVITADELSWLHKQQLITAPANQLVTIVYTNDKRVEGYGLDGNLKNSTFTFDRIVSGAFSL
ncbi:MAG TPA: LPS export ABC transporter periplasmic protein LptC [Sphaerochaeta sp.]|nr:LPS export ABC transporter periplasmic protein LptC [Sphaerochaeta sp.]HPY12422.1 LPS export ABC transporter periplasmic protein LptC [Sphaerochaeta sp.]HQB90579.1 LPS export ABC transporter periplasmic protein LptC [Sphaerochaeta sp.]